VLAGVVLGAALAVLAAVGVFLRVKAEGLAEGLLAPYLKLAPWLAVVLGLFVGAVGLWYLNQPLLFFIGVGVGAVAGLVVLGYDELLDRTWPSFYACVRRETFAQFATPIPYFVLFLFLMLTGFLFWATLKSSGVVSVRYVFMSLASICFFLFPLLTMGLFARERSEGTIEVLMTGPVSDAAVTVAKFIGTMVFYLAMLLPSLLYYFILVEVGSEIGKPDPGPVISAMIGMVLVGGFFISLGLFASALTASQILAAILAWMFVIFFMLARPIAEVAGLTYTWLGDILAYMNPTEEHLEPFLRGVIDPKDVVFFLSFTVFFLFLSVRTIETRKWR
jgi:gliding motility-associated transport system permease protein